MKLLYLAASRLSSASWSAGPRPAPKSAASLHSSSNSALVVIGCAAYIMRCSVSSSLGTGSLGSDCWKWYVGRRERCSTSKPGAVEGATELRPRCASGSCGRAAAERARPIPTRGLINRYRYDAPHQTFAVLADRCAGFGPLERRDAGSVQNTCWDVGPWVLGESRVGDPGWKAAVWGYAAWRMGRCRRTRRGRPRTMYTLYMSR